MYVEDEVRGGVVIPPNSAMGRELAKWNMPKSQGGEKCDGYQEFPKMLFRARPADHQNGKVLVSDPHHEDFTRGCQVIVHTRDEEARYTRQGWYPTQTEALDGYERTQIEIADATARRLFSDQTMSEKARTEAAVADAATHEHVPDVPRKTKEK